MLSLLPTWRRIARDLLSVLAGHWPQLLGLGLLGVIGRYGFVWVAVA